MYIVLLNYKSKNRWIYLFVYVDAYNDLNKMCIKINTITESYIHF